MIDPILATVAGLLLLAEFRWRRAVLRLVAIGMAVLLLVMATDLGPASRRALSSPRQVELPGGRGKATDFASGVLIMKSEAESNGRTILLPAVMLVWLSLTPVMLRFRGQNKP